MAGRLHWLLLCALLTMVWFSYRFQEIDPYKPPKPKAFRKSANQSQTTSPFPSYSMELLKLIEWPAPPRALTNFTFSTSPKNCNFRLLNPRPEYRVGETLDVVITARDHGGRPKEYGGDYFQAKLFTTPFKAGVTGQVMDFNNGTYLATFLLPWPGKVGVQVRLMHSSEAVVVVKQKREEHPEKVFFNGYFQYNGSSAVEECSLVVAGEDICTYSNPISGDTWYCVRPKKMPCHALIYHSVGGSCKTVTALENALLSNSVTDKTIQGSLPVIDIIKDNRSVELTSSLPACKPGQENPQPSGFYHGDMWTSLKCSARHFPKPTEALACLKGKNIHMFGDSTLRQWFEYLVSFIPSLKRIDLHLNYKSGPLLAVDADAGLVVRWRAHGVPLRTSKTMWSDLHYEAADIAGIGGGPDTVIMFTLWAHFTTFPVRFYLERLERVRQAIAALLFRSPATKVIIKSANTGSKTLYGSDWLSLQLDILLRAVFKGMAVTIIDVWDMTSCHYSPRGIHPRPQVIRNEVDLVLSHICPT